MIPDLVSTIIPVHNRPVQLQQAVASVLAQNYRPIEILVIDDGSNDMDTAAIANQLQAAYPEEIRIFSRPNGGPGLARETGRQAARGEYIQYLDSDDVLLPNKFKIQVTALRQQAGADVAYGITLYRDASNVLHPEPLKATGIPIPCMFPRFLLERWWETATPLYRRSICDQAGPWTDLCLEEDWEYDCRIAALGGQLVWCNQIVSEHRDHDGVRLSREVDPLDPQRLEQRARAKTLILGHAVRYGLAYSSPEMQTYARSQFLLARQCGAGGLDGWAESLISQALKITREGQRRGLDLFLYRQLARAVGWKAAFRLAESLSGTTGLQAVLGKTSQ
ncbi:glycosyltransferase family A protein [Synechococcus sp. CS-1328]|uniref:glycosyltransferase family 2 protein n=1 Tax=Synechococcus sp. CS-1328 TaxID=2847976 RepID=UPI00223B9954|nr:glycosyltransferase family A protein [Synechococcus sp. CS-1328]MCT0225918.1 glycosyltransferase family 2 protein [Synechococcus sp. CS-1328]